MSAKGSAAMQAAQDRVLVISRNFDAPRELVWKAWTDPAMRVQWLGPQGFAGKVLLMDLKPGGSYRFHMRGSDGVDHWVNGVFREVVDFERLVATYVWTDADGTPTRPETLLTVTFEATGSKTRLTLRQEVFESATACEAHRGGWTSSLVRLEEYLNSIAK